MGAAALPLMLAGFLHAQDAEPAGLPPPAGQAAAPATAASLGEPQTTTPEETTRQNALPEDGAGGGTAGSEEAPTYKSRWFVRVGALGALYHSRAVFSTGGAVIPGANAEVSDGATLSFDEGYDVTDNVAVMLMGGIPPRPNVIGKGAIAPLGTLGGVRYGPVILTAVYRFPEWRRLRPYVGGGVVRAFILKDFDGAVEQLRVDDNWGYALQAGVEYRLRRQWELYLDYKRVWLDVNAQGLLGPFPVRGRVTLDPDVVSAGLKFHFG